MAEASRFPRTMSSPKIINPASAKATRTRTAADSETLASVAEIAAKPTIANKSTGRNNGLLDDSTGL
jgi:hypothetical protein